MIMFHRILRINYKTNLHCEFMNSFLSICWSNFNVFLEYTILLYVLHKFKSYLFTQRLKSSLLSSLYSKCLNPHRSAKDTILI